MKVIYIVCANCKNKDIDKKEEKEKCIKRAKNEMFVPKNRLKSWTKITCMCCTIICMFNVCIILVWIIFQVINKLEKMTGYLIIWTTN